MNLGMPQLIYLGLTLIGIGVSMAQHGKPKTGKENVFVSLIANAVSFMLLYWGGFFN